jgi:pimeloyl-ACP methyl ester carboxylesterase
MGGKKSSPILHSVQTASGRISYTEQGAGPVALFVHGVLLNGHLWRHQLMELSDISAPYSCGPACTWRHRNRAGSGRIRDGECQDA